MKILFHQVVYFLTFTVLVFANRNEHFKNPICNDKQNEKPSFEVSASVIFLDKLFIIVFDLKENYNIVYEVKPSNINLNDQVSMNMHYAKPMTMEAKWGFDLVNWGTKISAAFGYTTFDDEGTVENENIAFVDEEGSGLVLQVSTGQLNPSSFNWPEGKASLVMGADNEGLFFEYNSTRPKHWTVQGGKFDENAVEQLQLSPHKFLLTSSFSNDYRFNLKKSCSNVTETKQLDWARLTGFIYNNHVFLFDNQWVYVFITNKDFLKTGQEFSFPYMKLSYADFFRCELLSFAGQLDEYKDNPLENFMQLEQESSNSSTLCLILMALLVTVAISFYIRSQIMKRKCAKYKIQRFYQ